MWGGVAVINPVAINLSESRRPIAGGIRRIP